jgi:hypothetical protein
VSVFLLVRVQFVDQIGAVIECDNGLVVNRGRDVFIIRAAILSTNREDGYLEILH